MDSTPKTFIGDKAIGWLTENLPKDQSDAILHAVQLLTGQIQLRFGEDAIARPILDLTVGTFTDSVELDGPNDKKPHKGMLLYVSGRTSTWVENGLPIDESCIGVIALETDDHHALTGRIWCDPKLQVPGRLTTTHVVGSTNARLH
jgi:hypothetical protein